MARQRMISDGFWKDPNLASLTTEQRTALVLFLTSEESNVIGIYRVIWRAVGAGMGWTHDQIVNAARDLQLKGCVVIHEETGWIWVKEWWKHNSLRGAFTGNVAKKAEQELKQVPEFWKQSVMDWLAENDYEGTCKALISPLQGAGGNPNPNPNPSSNPTTNQRMVVEIDDFVESAVWATPPTTSEAGFRRAVRQRIADGGPSPEDQRTLDAWRAWRGQQEAAAEEKERDAQRTKHDQKIRDAHHARLAAAMAFFDGLGEAKRGEVLAEFAEHLVAKQQSHVLNSLRRSGTENKMVQIALAEFVATAILCAAAEETA